MELGITHQSAVDAWECDQLEHLNVRYYGTRFSEAEAQAFATLGLPARPASKEALRFSAEIRRGAAVRIETRQESPLHLVHVLFDGEREAPSATLDAVYDGAEPGSAAGALLIEAYATVVYFDMVSIRPVPLPAGLREPSQGQA